MPGFPTPLEKFINLLQCEPSILAHNQENSDEDDHLHGEVKVTHVSSPVAVVGIYSMGVRRRLPF